VKHLSCVSILGRLQALSINIGLSWKSLPRTNTVAYLAHSLITAANVFKTLAPGGLFQKNITAVMEQHFYAFSLVIEGTAEKEFQFIMPIMSIYNRNLGFIQRNVFLKTRDRFKQ
jgi:hypothetical protein